MFKKQTNEYRKNVKDSVFKDLFGRKEYSLQLYKTLFPCDEEVTEEDINIVTCETVLVNGLYNDLGLVVRDTMLLLMEAQSTWSINILIRDFLYLAYTYKKYFDDNEIDLYGTKKVFIPRPVLYVLYTGDKELTKDEISLNEEYFNNQGFIDLKIKILTKKSLINAFERSKDTNIIYEYAKFTEISNAYVKELGRTKETAEKIIKDCIDNNVLKVYMEEHREEAESIMDLLFDEETLNRIHDRAVAKEAREEGIKQGMQQGIQQGMQQGRQEGIHQGMIDLLVRQFNDKKISAKEGADYLGITVKEFLDLVN